jgi:EmrB/QacA subfamily drug resistance transporter
MSKNKKKSFNKSKNINLKSSLLPQVAIINNSNELDINEVENAQNVPMKSGKLKWLSLLVLSLALAIIVIDGTVLNVSQKYVIQDLNSDIKTIQWAFTSYSLVLAALTILGGRLGDLFGRKKAFILGAFIFAIGSAVTAFAKDSSQLILGWSIIEGIGAALMVPASSALLVSNFEGKERGIAFGIYGATAGAASSFGPILGGFFASSIGWRWAFGINVVIAGLLILGSVIVKDDKKHYPKTVYLDFVGVILSSFGLLTLMYGIIESTNYGWLMAKKPWEVFGNSYNLIGLSVSFWSIILGLALIISFIAYEFKLEKRGKSPLVSMSIFRNRQFSIGVGTLSTLFAGFSGLITYGVVFFFLVVRGMGAFETGLALIPFSVSTFIMAPLSSKIADKIGQKNLVILGLIINAIGGILIYKAISYEAVPRDFIIPFIFTGLGFGMIAAQLNNIILSSVHVSQSGVASGINGTLREVGRAFGVSIIGAAFIASFTAGAVANINSQPDTLIASQIKSALVEQLNKGENTLGKDNIVTDEEILENAKKQGLDTTIDTLSKSYIINYRNTEQVIKEQINRSVTESSKMSMLYTLGFTCLAILVALNFENKRNIN